MEHILTHVQFILTDNLYIFIRRVSTECTTKQQRRSSLTFLNAARPLNEVALGGGRGDQTYTHNKWHRDAALQGIIHTAINKMYEEHWKRSVLLRGQ